MRALRALVLHSCHLMAVVLRSLVGTVPMRFSVYPDLIQFSYHRTFTFRQNEVVVWECSGGAMGPGVRRAWSMLAAAALGKPSSGPQDFRL